MFSPLACRRPSGSALGTVALVLGALMAVGCAARYWTSVALEGIDEPEATVRAGAVRRPGVDRSVRPPHCAEPSLPDYPLELADSGIDDVRVRVDFLLDTEGRPREIVPSLAAAPATDAVEAGRGAATAGRATAGAAKAGAVTVGTPTADAVAAGVGGAEADSGHAPETLRTFLEAAAATVGTWICSPAWRPTPGSARPWILLPYRTWVVFRFDAELVGERAVLERH